MKKLKVGVFMGGRSVEREVSFNSGRTVCDHLDTQRFEIIPIFQTEKGLLYILPLQFLHRGKISDFEHRLPYEGKQLSWESLKSTIDFMYLAVHGRYAEDGTLQGMLEMLKIPYLGTKVFSSALVMDKIIQRDFLQLHGIDIPKAISLSSHEVKNFSENIFKRMQDANINFPLVIKPHKEGSSLGIDIVFEKQKLCDALNKACFVYKNKEQSVLIEEKIEGMEFTCIVLVDKDTRELFAMPPTEIVTEKGKDFFDYEQKYMPGRATKITPARCSEDQIKKIQDTCIKVMQVLGIRTIGRIDGFLTSENKVVIIDPNTLSGMSPSSFLFRQAAEIGWSHTQLINHLIEEDLEYYGLDDSFKIKNFKEKNMNIEKIRVAVLLGGSSNEKEISLESGRNIVYKLSPEKYQPLPVFVSENMQFYAISQQLLVRGSTKEIESGLSDSMKIEWSDLSKMADFVFIALHGGQGENGCIQGALEMIGLPYNGSSVFASALCMDKYVTNQFLKHRGFEVPKGMLISKKEWFANCEETTGKILSQIQFPLILKPHDDGCSVMVSKITDVTTLQQNIELLFEKKEWALIEECIIGMELTIGVVGNDYPMALPASQAVSTQGILSIEEKFLPGQGENQTPAPISRDVALLAKKTMEDVFKAIGCKGYARIDCFYQNQEQSPTGKDRIVIIEVNTLPGMTPATCIFHQAAEINIKPMDFIDLIITLGFEEHQVKNTAISNTGSVEQLMANLNQVSGYKIKNI